MAKEPILIRNATVAQSVEQLIRNQQVAGSSPASSSKLWDCSSVGRAPALHAGGQGFESPQFHQIFVNKCIGMSKDTLMHKYAGIAQSVEQLICNQQVGGSSPSTSSKNWEFCPAMRQMEAG